MPQCWTSAGEWHLEDFLESHNNGQDQDRYMPFSVVNLSFCAKYRSTNCVVTSATGHCAKNIDLSLTIALLSGPAIHNPITISLFGLLVSKLWFEGLLDSSELCDSETVTDA
jgi:hypothetical protein